jgi:hypothetical protein
MSSRVYRPLAALLLGLLLGGLFVWLTKGRGDDDAPRGFALIHARCAERTAEAQRQVGITDPRHPPVRRFETMHYIPCHLRERISCLLPLRGEAAGAVEGAPGPPPAENYCRNQMWAYPSSTRPRRPMGRHVLGVRAYDARRSANPALPPTARPVPPRDPPDWYPCSWWRRGS